MPIVQLALPGDEPSQPLSDAAAAVGPLTNEYLINAAATAQREGRTGELWLDLLASNYHESMSFTAAWNLAKQKIAAALAT